MSGANQQAHTQFHPNNQLNISRYEGYTPPAVTSKTTSSPLHDSHDNLAYGDDSEGNATDNILYEPGMAGNTELFEWNPIYDGVGVEADDDIVDPTYAEPTK